MTIADADRARIRAACADIAIATVKRARGIAPYASEETLIADA